MTGEMSVHRGKITGTSFGRSLALAAANHSTSKSRGRGVGGGGV